MDEKEREEEIIATTEGGKYTAADIRLMHETNVRRLRVAGLAKGRETMARIRRERKAAKAADAGDEVMEKESE